MDSKCRTYFLGGGDNLKVINGKKGKGVQAFDETAKISHEIEKKTSLSKRSDGVISNKKIRTVGNNKPPDKKSKTPRGAPSVVSQKANYSRKDKSANNSSARNNNSVYKTSEIPSGTPSVVSQKAEYYSDKNNSVSNSAISNNYSANKPSETPRGAPSVASQKAEYYSDKNRSVSNNAISGNSSTNRQSENPRGAPSAVSQKAEYYSDKNKGVSNSAISNNYSISKPAETPRGAPSVVSQKVEHYYHKSRGIKSGAVGGNNSVEKTPETSRGIPSVINQKAEHYSHKGRGLKSAAASGNNSVYKTPKAPRGSPSAVFPSKDHLSKRTPAPNKKYKVLNNGTVVKDKLTKKKERVIYRKKVAKLQKAKPKKIRKQVIRINRKQADILRFAVGGNSALKKVDLSKAVGAVGGVKKAVTLTKKPVAALKRQFYSQADKSDDNGVKAAKLGLQIEEYGVSGLKTAVKTGAKTIKNGAKITKRVYRKIHKPTSAELRRRLRKQITRQNIGAQARFLAKRAVQNGAKTVGKAAGKTAVKTAKTAAKATAQAAKIAAKAAQAAAKAIASAVTKVVSLIAETMPYSLIIIVVILLIIIIALMAGSLVSSAGGTVAGGGAWLVDDSTDQTPEEIYDGYKDFIVKAKDVMETQAKDALQNKVTDFCSSDTSTPRKIIQYVDKNHNVTFYPAYGANGTINRYIEQFGTEDDADYMSLLFVLMTREKQQADGVTDEEIYDFDFKKEDFEEFMKTVNENSCRWGDTFAIKTTVETTGNTCPGQNCKIKYIPGCHCDYYIDDEGEIQYYCGGHPYCPGDHTKLTAKLYTVKDYYNKEYSEIYDFTDNEKARYEASKAIIQGLLEYWEG